MSRWLIVSILTAVGAYAVFNCCCSTKNNELPFRYEEPIQWGESDNADVSIRPFTVNISQETLDDLQHRLKAWKPVKPLQDVGYSYGMPLEALEKIVKQWRGSYDWRKQEAKLNTLPQFTTNLHGLKVHFIHVKGQTTDPKARRIPILMVHGWPGSVVEFYEVIPKLLEAKDGFVFDIVAPSIPGYGFSEAPVKTGFNCLAAAQTFAALMKRLGYDRYVYQGGDWGSMIGQLLARMFPENVIGVHLNFVTAPASTAFDQARFAAAIFAPNWVVGEAEAHKVGSAKWTWLLEEVGYMYEQMTKPDTVGAALSDSPVGLAAYILEKFAGWSEHVEFKSGKGIRNEDMITNVMIYWVTGHISTSLRFYKETAQSRAKMEGWMKLPYKVPTGVTCYPSEMLCAPKALLSREMPRLVHFEDMPVGGHFAAFEQPQLFEQDLRKAIKAFVAEDDKN